MLTVKQLLLADGLEVPEDSRRVCKWFKGQLTIRESVGLGH
jgi:hypothetical protein